MSKKNYLQILHIVPLTLLSTLFMPGCQSYPGADLREEVPASSPTVTLSLHAEAVESPQQGRASIDESALTPGSPTVFRWDAGDRVMLWMGEAQTPCIFITPEGGTYAASFTYTGPAVETDRYFGFYPASERKETTQFLYIPTDGTVRQELPDHSMHLGRYRAMYTESITGRSGETTLEKIIFKPLTSLVVFKISNESGTAVSYSSVTLETSGNSQPVFYSHATYTAGSGAKEVTLPSSPTDHSVTLSLGKEKGIPVASGNTFHAFLPLFPSASLTDSPLQLRITTDAGKTITRSFPGSLLRSIGSFRTGLFYLFHIRHTPSDELSITLPTIIGWEAGGEVELTVD